MNQNSANEQKKAIIESLYEMLDDLDQSEIDSLEDIIVNHFCSSSEGENGNIFRHMMTAEKKI